MCMHMITVECDVNSPVLTSQDFSLVLTVVIDFFYMAGEAILYLCLFWFCKKIVHFYYAMAAVTVMNWYFMSSGIIPDTTHIHTSVSNFAPVFSSLARRFTSRNHAITFHSKNTVLPLLQGVQVQAWVKSAWRALLEGLCNVPNSIYSHQKM